MLVTGQSGGGFASLFAWGFALIVLAGVGFVAVLYLRRWLRSPDESKPGAGGFTLGDLRELLRQGKISPDEYEAARIVIVDAAQRAAERQRAQAIELAKEQGVPPPVDDVERIRARRATATPVAPASAEPPRVPPPTP
jgi:hypothetical protein